MFKKLRDSPSGTIQTNQNFVVGTFSFVDIRILEVTRYSSEIYIFIHFVANQNFVVINIQKVYVTVSLNFPSKSQNFLAISTFPLCRH